MHEEAAKDHGAAKAACELQQYKASLRQAQIDRHRAYEIIHEAARNGLDYELWTSQFLVARSGRRCGWGRALGLSMRGDLRGHTPPGFKGSLSLGVNGSKNLVYSGRNPDPATAVSFSLIPAIGFGWTQSWFTVGLGLEWMPSPGTKAVLGQIGVAVLENWGGRDSNACNGFVGEVRLFVEPWISGSGARVILFGAELAFGGGWDRPQFNPYSDSRQKCGGSDQETAQQPNDAPKKDATAHPIADAKPVAAGTDPKVGKPVAAGTDPKVGKPVAATNAPAPAKAPVPAAR